MTTPQELERKFWKALIDDRTMMVGLDGVEDGHTRPLTAHCEKGGGGPIFFFASTDNSLVHSTEAGRRAIACFASKGHELFATVHGKLSIDRDRANLERHWNRFVAAWYEGGKDDPKLVLLRLDPEHAQIWENESSLLAGVKLLLGVDPKKDYADKVAEVALK